MQAIDDSRQPIVLNPPMPSAAAVQPPIDPPFEVVRPATQTMPVVFASPHSGNHYPADFVAAARLDPLALRRSGLPG